MTNFDQALSQIGIFFSLSDAERTAIARQCNWQRFSPGDQIIGHLDSSNNVYFIVQGTVRAVNFSQTGKEVSFRDIRPGEMFGEFAAIDDVPRSANVYALTDAFVGSLSAMAFRATLARHSTVALDVMRLLTAQIRRLTDRVFEFSTLAVNNRIDVEILRLAMAAGVTGNVAKISPAPTHAEFASRASTHREAVTREINALARAGIVEQAGRTLVVRDFERLQAAVAQTLGKPVAAPEG